MYMSFIVKNKYLYDSVALYYALIPCLNFVSLANKIVKKLIKRM